MGQTRIVHAKFILPLTIIGLVILSNGMIAWNTKSKIPIYAENPPFRLDDFTGSYKTSSQSKLNHLLDEDPDTKWIKWNEGSQDRDFDIELRLTHKWDGSSFVPIDWKNFQIKSCSHHPARFSILLREAINVDKELRLPDDTVIFTQEYNLDPTKPIEIPLDNLLNTKPTQAYPEGISILTLRGKFPQTASGMEPPCLESVVVE